MARMQLDYGFRVYYDDKGTLKEINPVDTKARDLRIITTRRLSKTPRRRRRITLARAAVTDLAMS
jgi:hypothetical protein